jgi:hypothetical protein
MRLCEVLQYLSLPHFLILLAFNKMTIPSARTCMHLFLTGRTSKKHRTGIFDCESFWRRLSFEPTQLAHKLHYCMIQHTHETNQIRDNPSSKNKVSHVFDLGLFADAKSPAAVQSQPSALLCCWSLSLSC